MMIHDGSADQGLIVHEVGHNYTDGAAGQQRVARGLAGRGVHQLPDQLVLGDRWAGPAATATPRRTCCELDLDGYSEPPSLRGRALTATSPPTTSRSTPGASCSSTSSAPSWATQTMHRILRTFYERWKYRHVDEAAFRAVAEEVSGRDLSTFFAQWLHTTELYDYAVGRVQTRARRRRVDLTRVEVVRKAPGRFPGGRGGRRRRATPRWRAPTGSPSASGSSSGPARRPREVVLDPLVRAPRLEHAQQPEAARVLARRSCSRRCRGPTSTSTAYFSTRVQPRPADGRAPAGGLVQRRRRASPSACGAGATTWAGSSRTWPW